jgi:hypothetical protein
MPDDYRLAYGDSNREAVYMGRPHSAQFAEIAVDLKK